MANENEKRTVTWSLLVTAIIVTGGKLIRGESLMPRDFVALLATGLGLAALSAVAPQVAAPLAVLVLISATFAQGERTVRRLLSPRVTRPPRSTIAGGLAEFVPDFITGGLSGGTNVSGMTAAASAALVAMRTFVTARYPDATFVVVSTVRPGAIVAGTNSPSEHAFGNAVDVKILRGGVLYKSAMDALYNFLRLTPYCELCWAGKGGCTTGHYDHLHYAPLPCRAG